MCKLRNTSTDLGPTQEIGKEVGGSIIDVLGWGRLAGKR